MASLGQALMIAGLVILCVPGVLFNNMVASGYAQTGEPGLTCPGTVNGVLDVTCQGSTSVGCQAVPSACTLNGASISFLNQNSPFTQLISGNIFGLFSFLTNTGATSANARTAPFQSTGSATYIYADCGVTQNSGAGLQKWAIAHCTQTDIDNGNLTETSVNKWSNWNPTLSASTGTLQFYRLGNGSFPLSCSWDFQINYTAVTGNGWTYYGCTVSKTAQVVTNLEWTFLVAVNNNVGGLAGGYNHRFVYIQTTNWYTQGCSGNGLTGNIRTDQCDAWAKSFAGFNIPGTTTSFVPNGALGPIMGFVIGIALFLIGTGISIQTTGSVMASGGGVGIGFNRQGTKLAQVLGLGLIIYSPMFSEFSLWFSSGYLPYGLDGSLGIVSIMVSAVFFSGTIWWATQD